MLGNFSDRRDHDAPERQGFRRAHPADQPDAEVGQHRARVALVVEGAEPFGRLGELPADDLLEQLVLRAEIGVEGSLRDAGGAGDVVHARPVEARGEKHRACAVYDLAPFGAAVMMDVDFFVENCGFHSP